MQRLILNLASTKIALIDDGQIGTDRICVRNYRSTKILLGCIGPFCMGLCNAACCQQVVLDIRRHKHDARIFSYGFQLINLLNIARRRTAGNN
jgi:hypothetical protein